MHVPLVIVVALALLLGGWDRIAGDGGEDGAGKRAAEGVSGGGKGSAGGTGAGGEKAAPAARLFDGTGYRFTIAPGWRDRTEDAASVEDLGLEQPEVEAIEVDAVIAARSQQGRFTPNLTIVRTSEGIPEGVSARRLAEANLRTARQLGTVPPGATAGNGGDDVSFGDASVRPAKLGGEPAAYYEQTADSPAGRIRQRQIYAIQEGTAYALTFGSVDGSQWAANLPKLRRMLASWSWE